MCRNNPEPDRWTKQSIIMGNTPHGRKGVQYHQQEQQEGFIEVIMLMRYVRWNDGLTQCNSSTPNIPKLGPKRVISYI